MRGLLLLTVLSLSHVHLPAGMAMDPLCRDQLKPSLRELSAFDANSIARKIEEKTLTLKQVQGQGVFRVLGLPRGKSFMVRKDTLTHYDSDFGIRTHGLDLRTRMKRDVAACRLDRILGFHLVPETRLTTIDGAEASIQVRVIGTEFRGAKAYENFLEANVRKNPELELRHKIELERMAVLDIISGNTDRNITNFIYDDEHHRIWAIDHADSFPVVEKTAGGHWFWLYWSDELTKPLEADTRNRIQALDPKAIAGKMRELKLLEEEAITTMVRRIELLKADLAANPKSSMQEIASRIERKIVRFGLRGSSP